MDPRQRNNTPRNNLRKSNEHLFKEHKIIPETPKKVYEDNFKLPNIKFNDTLNKKFGTNFTTQDATNKLNNLTKDEQWIINNTNENMKLFYKVMGKSQTDYKTGWSILLQQLAAIF